ncbi:helix-turn-helix domain-containing protein [Hyphococcus luteus]|uniref:HTH araC/xylS-type domain-containing protein n=1 Tax=Hyphococcus luteus TaxID=2058213 RepID=A0A2S7K816_9PROT|nr:helix-turn-helix transcriptional regulator [Marinicaulis flavus]PQA88640.1 hypothetical protein CW354_10190 [Marinicaulis flavus]
MASLLKPSGVDAPDHALGQYRAWKIADGPEAPADLAWISAAGAGAPCAHRLLPHGEPSLALLRRRTLDGEVSELRVVVCGPYYKAKQYRPSPREELIAVRLKPEVSAALFGIAPADYSNAAIANAPPVLTDACARTLRLGETADAFSVLDALKDDVQRFTQGRAFKNGPESRAAETMRKTEGRIRLREIAGALGVSERHLRRRFADHVGCAPKAYARYLQITAAALAAERHAAPDWANIAAGAGFHDQAHMINAFKAETGLTPTAFHAERRALL